MELLIGVFVTNREMKGGPEKVQDYNDHEENETHAAEIHPAVLVRLPSGVTLESLSISPDMVCGHVDNIVKFMEDLILLLDFISHHVGLVLAVRELEMQPSTQRVPHSSPPEWCQSLAYSFHTLGATPSASPSSLPRHIRSHPEHPIDLSFTKHSFLYPHCTALENLVAR